MSKFPLPDSGDSSMAERWRRSQDSASQARAERNDPTPSGGVAPATRCPSCRSDDVKTTSKVVNAETYWRCCGCGEVWNVGRNRQGSRYGRELPFRG